MIFANDKCEMLIGLDNILFQSNICTYTIYYNKMQKGLRRKLRNAY
jgi:hypothetical protein